MRESPLVASWVWACDAHGCDKRIVLRRDRTGMRWLVDGRLEAGVKGGTDVEVLTAARWVKDGGRLFCARHAERAGLLART
ncbi:MAG TPA: hypothetical protein VL984_06160 [Acidimicrobiales bacterium]|nr:hypothetical protein [Acidimicrobiales bacterium]